MNVVPIRTRIFKEGEDLIRFVKQHVRALPSGSVLAVTSKIVALSERRTGRLADKVRLIKQESDWAMRTKYVWLTVRKGLVMASAGIDESNADGKLILLPRDSFKAAARLRRELQAHYRIKKLGVVITDSRIFPLRNGVVGVAVGYAGFKGIKDYTGTPDLFGRKFHFSKVDAADGLATAAVVAMGEGRECQPLAIIKDAPVAFTDRVTRRELEINIADDLYRPLFSRVKKLRKKFKNAK
jgi:F420-0:gamma-glutamyl ligase